MLAKNILKREDFSQPEATARFGDSTSLMMAVKMSLLEHERELMQVCVHVYMYMCVCVHKESAHAGMYACMYVYVCMRAYTSLMMAVKMSLLEHMRERERAQVGMYVCTCVYACIHVPKP